MGSGRGNPPRALTRRPSAPCELPRPRRAPGWEARARGGRRCGVCCCLGGLPSQPRGRKCSFSRSRVRGQRGWVAALPRLRPHLAHLPSPQTQRARRALHPCFGRCSLFCPPPNFMSEAQGLSSSLPSYFYLPVFPLENPSRRSSPHTQIISSLHLPSLHSLYSGKKL